jgi:hypothetical protein
MAHTIIDIKPHRGGWKVFEGPGVEPYYDDRRNALGYAEFRSRSRRGEIRILDAAGNVEATIPFDDSARKR